MSFAAKNENKENLHNQPYVITTDSELNKPSFPLRLKKSFI